MPIYIHLLGWQKLKTDSTKSGCSTVDVHTLWPSKSIPEMCAAVHQDSCIRTFITVFFFQQPEAGSNLMCTKVD